MGFREPSHSKVSELDPVKAQNYWKIHNEPDNRDLKSTTCFQEPDNL